MMHVELLLKIGNIFPIDAFAINLKIHVEQIEAAQKIADSSSSIQIICTCKHNIFYLEWFGRRNNADHSVANRNAVIIIRVDVGGFDDPGVLRKSKKREWKSKK